jgi:hypothetical protein
MGFRLVRVLFIYFGTLELGILIFFSLQSVRHF